MNSYKIQALSQEEAIEKVISEFDIKRENIVNIEEEKKPKSFLGFFKKSGTFTVSIKKEKTLGELTLEQAKELLKMMNLNLVPEIIEESERYILINLQGEDNGIIIGKKGKTLNSFEYLLNSLIKNGKVEVDVEGFKEKRANTLRDLARKMAEKALKTEKAIKLNPMPPRERKIIHEIVNKYDKLDTFSEGRDPKRYIVIKKKRG